MLLDIIIALFLFLGFFIGWQQGLFRFFRSILPFAGAVVVAVFACIPLANFLVGTELIGNPINEWVAGWFSELGELAYVTLYVPEEGSIYLYALGESIGSLADALSETFSFFAGMAESILTRTVALETGDYLIASIVPGISTLLLTAVSFVAVFLVSLLVIFLIVRLIDKILKEGRVFRAINKFFGGIAWLAIAIFVVYGLLALLSLFSTTEAMIPLVEYMEESSFVTSILYENNFIMMIVDFFRNRG